MNIPIEVKAGHTFKWTKVFIGEHLHLCFQKDKLLGFQTWLNEGNQYLELTFMDGTTIKTEYDSKELFLSIVKLLNDLMN